MKAEPYKFWCSQCQVRHAGECGYPAVGSRWRAESRYKLDHPWKTSDIVMTVVRLEPGKIWLTWDGGKQNYDSSLDSWKKAHEPDGMLEPSTQLWLRFLEVS